MTTIDTPRAHTMESGSGRVDANGIEWFACDPYPTWYRWVDGVLHCAGGQVYGGVDERPTWEEQP